MAKVKRDINILRYKDIKKKRKFTPWFENKIKAIRRIRKLVAARASKWGAPSGVALIILIALTSFFLPKNEFQQLKEKLVKFPNNFEAHLKLAEKFLENNQFEEAENSLLLAQQLAEKEPKQSKVLGESSKLEQLWQQKHYSDPEDIKKLISTWEKIIEQKPNYRDAYLQLAILNYKIYENKKALEFLKEALEIDPNFPAAKDLEKLINQS